MISKKDEVITIEDDGDDIVQGVFVKEDPIDAFSLKGKIIFLDKKWLIQAKMIKYLTRLGH